MAYMEVEGLTRVYRQKGRQVTALRDVTFSVDRGEMIAVVGRSGSGKSTLMQLLGCLDRPTAGSYRLEGREVTELSVGRLAALRGREIGFVFQQFHLLPTLTALENVELPLLYRGIPRRERRRRAEECLCQMGLAHRLTHMPAELSGGQQQRVAIARAVAGRPPLVLADEPTGNLDRASAAGVMECLRRLHRQGTTLLLITHDEGLAASLPRRLRLAEGELVPGEERFFV